MPQLTISHRRACPSRFSNHVSHAVRWGSSHSTSAHNSKINLLRHHHLRADSPNGIVSYSHADHLQETLRAELTEWKYGVKCSTEVPRPSLISFESSPTFTLGRRQDDLTQDQLDRLKRPLNVNLPFRQQPVYHCTFNPDVCKTKRGGLTTYHGPGQIVFWPVLDMHSPLYEKFQVYSYAEHLESTTRRLLAQVFGIRTYTSGEPGVWVSTKEGQQPRKIAAMGVHHKRYVTALGIALNIDVPVTGDELVNPWARFVPCGLEGKAVTSVLAEVGSQGGVLNVAELADLWAEIFEEGLMDASKRVFEGHGNSRSR